MSENHNPKISIFIPIYNGEQFLKRTLNSILAQTLEDFEVVCVDDSSTDGSFDLVWQYAQADARIKPHRKPNGGNVPRSWMYALPYLNGHYTLYCSQDDFFSSDLLEQLYLQATRTDADATIPALVHYRGNKDAQVISGIEGDTQRTLSGREAFMFSLDWRIHAFALWRTSLIKQVGFDDLATNSDEYATRCFFLNSNKVVFSQGIFYYNKENPQAITAHISPKRWEWCITNVRLMRLMQAQQFSAQEQAWFAYKVWGNTIHLHRLYIAHQASFAQNEKKHIQQILSDTYASIDWRTIATHLAFKGKVIRLIYGNGFKMNHLLLSCQQRIGK